MSDKSELDKSEPLVAKTYLTDLTTYQQGNTKTRQILVKNNSKQYHYSAKYKTVSLKIGWSRLYRRKICTICLKSQVVWNGSSRKLIISFVVLAEVVIVLGLGALFPLFVLLSSQRVRSSHSCLALQGIMKLYIITKSMRTLWLVKPIRNSRAAGSWFTNSSRVLPISRVVYQPL